MTDFNQIIPEAIKLILSGTFGGFIGAKTNDWLTRRRERDTGIANRRRNLIAFVAHLKTEAANIPSTQWETFYRGRISQLRYHAELVAGDLAQGQRDELERMVASVCDLDATKICNWDEHPELFKKMAAIADFIKNLPKG